MIYLDNAATTPLAPEVLEAMMPYMTEHYGNPSAVHGFGRASRAAIEAARKIVAETLNAGTGEIFFTSGGTESNNTAIKCAVRDLGVKRIITSRIEHHCVLHTVDALCEEVELVMLSVKPDGHVDLDELERMLAAGGPKTLVTLMHANNEIGNLLDLERVSNLCTTHGAYFHTDTVQTVGHYPMDVQKVKIHFLSGSGHKFHGPKGIGLLYVNSEVQIKPHLHGGSQERNMRAGTENIYGIVGLGKAMEHAYAHLEADRQHIEGLRSMMRDSLQKAIPGVEFNGQPDGLYTILSVLLPETDMSEMVIYNLDLAGIACSAGSACSSGSNKGSHVLAELGVNMKRPGIRFSFSRYNTEEDVKAAVAVLKEMFTPAVA